MDSRAQSRFNVQFVLVISFWAWVIASLLTPIAATDFWWHLASGRYMWAYHIIPRVDIFSLTCRGNAWIDFEWLYQVVSFAMFRLGGYCGITFLKCVLISGSLATLILRLKHTRVTPIMVYIASAMIFSACAAGWSERADLFSILLVSALLYHLESIRRGQGSARALWLWTGGFLVWANWHAGYMIGWGIAFLYAVELYRLRRLRLLVVILWLTSLVLATLVTPYGFGLWRQMAESLSHVPIAFQNEFSPPPWPQMAVFWMSLGLHFLLMIYAWRYHHVNDWLAWLLSLGLGYFALRHARFAPFFMFIAFPYSIAMAFPQKPAASQWAGALPGLTVFFFIMAVLKIPNIQSGINDHEVPAAACDYIEKERVGHRFFVDYDFSSYWIWRFAGDPPVFIDGRVDTVKGYVELLREIRAAQLGTPAQWQHFLKSYDLRGALLRYPQPNTGSSTFKHYMPKNNWALVYWDDTALVYLRRDAYPAQRLQSLEFGCLDPDLTSEEFIASAVADPKSWACLEKDIARNLQWHPTSRRSHRYAVLLNEVIKKGTGKVILSL